MDFPSKIKILRLLQGDDQLDLARSLGMKSATHVNRWERGLSTARTPMLQLLGNALDVSWPWLVDSSSRFSDKECIDYRPLSPYLTYTPRWLALLATDLGKLLPEFFAEIAFDKYWFFKAPCAGGIAVAAKQNFTMVITCHPHLAISVQNSMISPNILDISNYMYANNFFLGKGLNNILSKCGLTYKIEEDNTTVEHNDQYTKVDIHISAKLPKGADNNYTRSLIQDNVDNFISSILSDCVTKIDITPPKSKYDYLLGQVEDEDLKAIALEFYNKMLLEDPFHDTHSI